jgi:uncharacterized protein YeaO (DUF488 family)
MPIKTKRWNDRKERDDGYRILICRYRPRALPKAKETWRKWYPFLGPSKELHADFYGKNGKSPIGWAEYERRYLEEMKDQAESIDALAELVEEGKTITLLCSKACEDEHHCHRTLLRRLIEERVAARQLEKATAGNPAQLSEAVPVPAADRDASP